MNYLKYRELESKEEFERKNLNSQNIINAVEFCLMAERHFKDKILKHVKIKMFMEELNLGT